MATLTLGETIKLNGDFQVEVVEMEDGRIAYELTEDGDVYDQYPTLAAARRVAQRTVNAYLAQELRDLISDDDDKTFQISCKLEDSTKPEAEQKLRAMIAELVA